MLISARVNDYVAYAAIFRSVSEARPLRTTVTMRMESWLCGLLLCCVGVEVSSVESRVQLCAALESWNVFVCSCLNFLSGWMLI